MDIKALKNKILQLAIQGKLVPQYENDEPASVLLERIKEEKEQLIKDKVIKKEKQLPEISEDEKLFELPNGWEWCRLGNICRFINGDRGKNYPSKKDLIDKGIPFINAGHLLNGEVSKISMNYIREDKYESLSSGKVKNNDIIYCLRGTLGKNAIVRDISKGAIASSLVIIRLILNESVDIRFLYYFINSKYELVQRNSYDNGSAQPNLSADNVKKFLIPIPPLEEQKRIVAKVESLFKLIDELDNNKQDLLQNISDSRNKILQLAIQGKLVSQDEDDESASVLLEKIKEEKEQLIKDKVIRKEKAFPEITDDEKLFNLPNGWEWCRLGDIGIYKKGPFGSTITKSMFVPKSENTVKVYEQKNAIQKDWRLGEYYVTKEYFESKLKGFEVFEGDIIVSCAGTIGETYIMPSGIEKGVINQALMKMKIFEGVNVDYFLMYFDFILKETSKESSKGSAIKNIPPFEIFKKMLLPLPPIEEQKRIIAKVDIIMKYLDTLEKQIN